jgi:D-alanine-D-alanine ligase
MKKTVGILFGGKSAEHEISLLSAKNIYDAIDREKFEPVLIGIDKTGRWLTNDAQKFFLNADNPSLIKLNTEESKLVTLQPKDNTRAGLDVVFPVLHGPFGEDGIVQGFLKLTDLPFVGSGVLGSAAGMDKDVMKRLLRDAGLPIGKFIALKNHEKTPSFAEVKTTLYANDIQDMPVFIKPANMGSSIGVSKVQNEAEYTAAIKDAFQYDTKIVMEEFIAGREIECAVLGNEEPIASVPGEIIPTADFYSYNAKYIDENGAKLIIPARINESTTMRVQELAIQVFKILCCEGLSRVDFFLKSNGEIIVNEINTMPGFTKISMYPKMWEYSGVSYTELITRLIELAMARFEKERQLKTVKQQ